MYMKKGFWIGFGIVASIGILMGVYVFGTIRNYIKSSRWELKTEMTDDKKDLFSNVALLPGLAPCIERYAERGFRDTSYMIETYRYADADKMCEALPEGCEEGIRKALASDPAIAKDISGESVDLYSVTTGLPVIEEDQIDDKYKNEYIGAFKSYYVIGYSDGTYRFAVQIDDV
jgi:hypothetical protein